MKIKYIVSIVVAVAVIGGLIYFTAMRKSPNNVAVNAPAEQPGQNSAGNQPAAQPAGQQPSQGITTVSTNNGSVAGVDLSGFATEANQSASLSAQDGAADAQTISSDGANINSSTDSVNNPIQ